MAIRDEPMYRRAMLQQAEDDRQMSLREQMDQRLGQTLVTSQTIYRRPQRMTNDSPQPVMFHCGEIEEKFQQRLADKDRVIQSGTNYLIKR